LFLVILLTAYATIETAVEAMKLGAYHFANKPFNLDDVAALVERALETTRLRREVRQYRANAARPYSLQRIVGASSAMIALRHLVARVAVSPSSTVLLTGRAAPARISIESGSCCIAVRDRGLGIPADARERVFEPFFTTRAGGTGLGLAIVKRLLELHDGSIELKDRDGGGTVAEITLPLAPLRRAGSS
jgi:light-regulated signal transduction histidine kinase (bacteriophytochrome)